MTVTALLDTTLRNVPAPTGTVSFANWGPMIPIGGTETYSTVTDSSGNVALEASLSFVPATSVSVSASYAGDSNYLGSQRSGPGKHHRYGLRLRIGFQSAFTVARGSTGDARDLCTRSVELYREH